ncbi:MAG: hypothetical protein M1812_001785 [Candelaria pacifica]|nr:MAG: hypothetical protein M1812_001785 [Candelaria pacifica]
MATERAPSHGGLHPSPSTPFAPSNTASSSRQKQLSSTASNAPSFSAFRARVSSVSNTSPVRRKPLPATASPVATRLSSAESFPPTSGQQIIRPVSIDGRSPREPIERAGWPSRPSSTSSPFVLRDLDRFPHGQTPIIPPAQRSSNDIQGATGSEGQHFTGVGASENRGRTFTPKNHASITNGFATENSETSAPTQQPKNLIQDTRENGQLSAMSLHPSNKHPNLTLQLDANSRSLSHHSNTSQESTSTSRPKSPSQKLTSFFGWKASSPGADSATTTFTDKTPSPVASPHSPNTSAGGYSYVNRSMPPALDILKANATSQAPIPAGSYLSLPPSTPTSTQLRNMEAELREISSELAGSIRREMDLEDLVERLQLEASQPPDPGRRTSDYFSDSGISSLKYYPGDGDPKTEELERMRRKAEQEKARLLVDLSQQVQDERSRRKAMESHTRGLEDRLQKMDHESMRSADANERVKDLETSLEDLRRRLTDERHIKANFEDLLTALREEIEQSRNERDNLRDEVVPQLRAQVEGLEADAAEFQSLTYDNTRMQQELQSLKNENTTLVNARKLQLEMQQQQQRYNSIAEEPPSPRTAVGLTRSNSLARGSIMGGSRPGLARTSSIKERESRDSLADRVKDIEMQRDALHLALRGLLERQEYQNKVTNKRIRALETERDRANSGSPRRRMGYNREVTQLRDEINQLRRRADDALEQKWQCEKGLSGLKMDLDRAEQETGSLRTLLQEHDILVPTIAGFSPETIQMDGQATSASLEKAYQELQTTHALSVTRIRQMQGGGSSAAAVAETKKVMDLLKHSISDAEQERDAAQKQAEQYRLQAESLQESERSHIGEEQSLASQLTASAGRVEDLAAQIRLQLESNNSLRQRLAEAIGRGEREQRASADRINELQGKLKCLEDKVMAAQQQSEDAVVKHEEEVKDLKDSQSAQLQRLKGGFMSPIKFSPKSPLSPLFTARSPRLNVTSSGLGMSMTEASKAEFLERRVAELEKALGDADKEMEEVVGRMNMAQIEVMELQSERDEAMRRTRKLQAQAVSEREKVKAFMA